MGRLNQPAQPGYQYRSPGQTNANDLMPNLGEDAVTSQRADNARMRRGFSGNESPAQTEARRNSPHGNISQRDAAGRAVLRTTGRAGLQGAALEAGFQAGRALDEETGAGKKLVEGTGLGKMAERIAKPSEKVELSDYAKQRFNEEEVDDLTRKTKAEVNAERASKKDQEKFDEEKVYKRGGRVSVSKASSRGDGIAQRGKTKGKMR
jgi:hypothetical protein